MLRTSSPARRRRGIFLFALLTATALAASLLAQTGSPDIQVLNGTAVVAPNATVSFGSTPVGVAKAITFTVKNTGAAALLVSEAITVPPGFTLMASFPGVPDANLSTSPHVPGFTIAPGATATFIVALNSATAGGFAGNVSFQTNVTGKNPFVFRVTGTVVPPPAVRAVDDKDAGFTFTAGWTQGYTEVGASGKLPFRRTLTWAFPGTGTETATWTFTGLQPGDYKVAATWAGYSWAASNAPFTLHNGTTPVGTLRVDQRVPSAGFTDGASVWQDLGTVTVTGSSLTVKLSDDADNYLVADAVRIFRVGYPGEMLDDTSTAFTVTGSWVRNYTEPGARDFQLGTARAQATATPGTATATARWSFTVVPGTYRVMAGFSGYPWAATNTPYRVFDGTVNLTPTPIRVNQTVTPTTLLDAGAGWRHLGFFTVTSTALAVEVTNDANNRVTADAVRIERVNAPTTPSLPDTVRL